MKFRSKIIKTETEFTIDFQFWAILPALNLNLSGGGFTLEFEWLCFGIYHEPNK